MINHKVIVHTVGVVLSLLGGLMMLPLAFSYYFNAEDDSVLFFSAAITLIVGESLRFLGKNTSTMKVGKREGYLIVVLAWFGMSLFSVLPYYLSGVIPDFKMALFESVSGLTTTGATVLLDIESLPQGILFWRSLTQWIGGMGIIVLTVAIFPLFGLGGVELYKAEVPGPSKERIHPRVLDTAQVLWGIYTGLTLLLVILLYLFGMSFYDACNHALTTMATGGFSTKNASIAAFPNAAIQYLLILFMFIAGSNYVVIHYGLKKQFNQILKQEEFLAYLLLVVVLSVTVCLGIYWQQEVSLEQAFRDSTFQVVSIITTTGFISADYTQFFPSSSLLFFFLLFAGACSGSTSGGIKVIRHLVLIKHVRAAFGKLVNPRLIAPLQLHKKPIKQNYLEHITAFIVVYGFLFFIGCTFMSIILYDTKDAFKTALSSVATCLGNVGPGLGSVGPTDNFASLPSSSHWLLIIFMLLGRLELFSILILFFPYFWKK